MLWMFASASWMMRNSAEWRPSRMLARDENATNREWPFAQQFIVSKLHPSDHDILLLNLPVNSLA